MQDTLANIEELRYWPQPKYSYHFF